MNEENRIRPCNDKYQRIQFILIRRARHDDVDKKSVGKKNIESLPTKALIISHLECDATGCLDESMRKGLAAFEKECNYFIIEFKRSD